MTNIPFTSRTLTAHLLRGVIGFTALFFAFGLGVERPLVVIGLVALALFAFRGCPTCWAAGLIGTTCNMRRKPPSQ